MVSLNTQVRFAYASLSAVRLVYHAAEKTSHLEVTTGLTTFSLVCPSQKGLFLEAVFVRLRSDAPHSQIRLVPAG